MDINRFSHILTTRYAYKTGPAHRFVAKTIPGFATAIYYLRLITLITRSSLIAKRGQYTNETWNNDSRWILKIVESAGGRIEISGIRGYANHPGPLVFIANHMSMLDTFVFPSLILPFHRVTYVIKESLLDYPVFGAIMRAVNPIAVARKNPRKDLKTVLDMGCQKLADNCSVIIFPQATRSARFEPAMFNSLGVKLARKAGVPVVPVALKTDFQQNGRLIKEAGVIKPQRTIHIHFGDPMAVVGPGQETHREIVSFIRRHLTGWGAVIPSDPTG